ncbi:uncharacterized protein LOC133184828 [Saccostrea echinata]|uniref:uncharacterized protein LOC133184828 n=1 Tax=Saccostrea echinata TaxID=191078 RepID=UPI002A831411|nr:uncharacterized protein LOC133184828 [Saccostrea echinata]
MCDNGTCVCRYGYTAVNSTYCQQGNGIGVTLGATFGGFILGVLFTVLVVYILYRRYSSDMRKREEPGVAFVGNDGCSTNSAVEVIQGQTLKDKGRQVQRKVVNVPPYAPSVESPTYSNVQEAGKSRLKNDYVYNHLNEKEETPENNDHYDVAPGTSRLAETESDYSHLNAGRRNDRVILSQDDEYACTEESNTDNYFTLEKQ